MSRSDCPKIVPESAIGLRNNLADALRRSVESAADLNQTVACVSYRAMERVTPASAFIEASKHLAAVMESARNRG